MYEVAPLLARLDMTPDFSGVGVAQLAKAGGSMSGTAFVSSVDDFYLTNPIARASSVMAELSALKAANTEELVGADG